MGLSLVLCSYQGITCVIQTSNLFYFQTLLWLVILKAQIIWECCTWLFADVCQLCSEKIPKLILLYSLMSCMCSLECLFPNWKGAKIYLKNKVQRGSLSISLRVYCFWGVLGLLYIHLLCSFKVKQSTSDLPIRLLNVVFCQLGSWGSLFLVN